MSTKDIINETSLSFRIGGVKASSRNHKTELTLLDGYEFRDENGNVINATKIVLEKKKKEYPKTYEEFVSLVNRMREAQERAEMITGEEDINFIDMLFVERREAEREVDEYLKKMEEQL